MSSVITTIHYQKQVIHQPSTLQFTNPKKSKSPKRVLLHHPMAPSQLDDWVLFPQDTVTHKHSSVRHVKCRKDMKSATNGRQTLPLPDSHVIRSKAATLARCDESRRRQSPKPYKPSTCLYHMSARNCTPACADVKSLSETSTPPKAPSPPRLPTPDLSDFEDEDLWSCCRFSESTQSNESDESNVSVQHDDEFWKEMGKLTHRPMFREHHIDK